jgi:glycosyltransferase involved in cell wall biosynthesis
MPMKISIVVPVYNGEETIGRCLEALLNQDYPKGDYEIIVVNDGSGDDTQQIAQQYPVQIIKLDKNHGRVIARERGAQAARYEHLLFVDVRVIVAPDILMQIAKINYQPLLAGEHGEDKYRSPFDTLFYLIRRRVYSPYYPQRCWGKELWIEQSNFDRAPKGLTCFFCSRQLFLQSIPSRKDKTVNDDTRLLRSMVERKKLLRHTDLRITYLQRTDWKTVLRHIYERGPRFADYYLNGPSRYYNLWRGGLLLLAGFVGLSIYSTACLFYGLLILGLGILGVALALSENPRDFIIVLIYFPLIALAFGVGIIKGKITSCLSRF